jgi:SAM-dependent methyltransferase
MLMTDFSEVTELAGEEVSSEQVMRVCTRYAWAVKYCDGKDVLEIACGSGPGLGVLAKRARSLVAGDISESILGRARRHYGSRIDLRVMDAQSLPFPDSSLDVVIIFEALYYVPDAECFMKECRRVLRRGGMVLVSNANKDLSDFNPSPHSHVYHGVAELTGLARRHGMEPEFFGDIPIAEVSWRQKVLRPVKKCAVALGLVPRSMAGKRLLKRLVFGSPATFPPEVLDSMLPGDLHLASLPAGVADRKHKVVLCAARTC